MRPWGISIRQRQISLNELKLSMNNFIQLDACKQRDDTWKVFIENKLKNLLKNWLKKLIEKTKKLKMIRTYISKKSRVLNWEKLINNWFR